MGKALLTPRHSLNAFFQIPSQLDARTGGTSSLQPPKSKLLLILTTVFSTSIIFNIVKCVTKDVIFRIFLRALVSSSAIS